MKSIALNYVDVMNILMCLTEAFKDSCEDLDLDVLDISTERDQLEDVCDLARLILKFADFRDELRECT